MTDQYGVDPIIPVLDRETAILELSALFYFGTPTEQRRAAAALEQMGVAPAARERIAMEAGERRATQGIPRNARYRGNFGSYSDGLAYLAAAGIPLEYAFVDMAGNVWVIP